MVNNSELGSLLSWVGGKRSCVGKINEIMPPHSCYIEPFFGGGSIFFGKEPVKVEVINDLNGQLINFWRVIQRKSEKFLERSKYEFYSRECFEEYKSDWENGNHMELQDVEQAFRFYCLIRESFSSIFATGWSYGCTKANPTTFQNTFDLVDVIAKRMRNCYIDNLDFEQVIRNYDCPGALHFVDSPYVKADVGQFYFRSYSKEQQNVAKFTLYDHQRIYNVLSQIKGKFIQTIDDCAWIRERYCQDEQGSHGFWWEENEIYYSVADADSRKHVVELIITNYDIEAQRRKNAGRVLGRLGRGLGDF